MDRNPYDTSIDWLQQSPTYKQESVYTTQTQTPPVAKKAAPAKQPRMPKQKALEVVSSLKKGIIVSSVMSFGVISLLATGHGIGTTTNTTTTTTPATSSSSTATPTTSITTPSSSSSSSSTSSSSNSSSTSSSSQSSGASFGTSSSQGSVTSTSVS